MTPHSPLKRCALGLVAGPMLVSPITFAQTPAASSRTVQTDKGLVRGLVTADGKVVAYKGIPFGRPPVGWYAAGLVDQRATTAVPISPNQPPRLARTQAKNCSR